MRVEGSCIRLIRRGLVMTRCGSDRASVDGVGQPSDLAGLSRRKWYLMAAGWSLLLLVPAIIALTSDEPLPVRL